jgi:hypothetical protein
MDFWWDTLYWSGWFWQTIQCISRNSLPGCPGQMHNIQEMDGMHCPGPGRTHRIQKMVGYTTGLGGSDERYSVSTISHNSLPGCLGWSHNIQEMDGCGSGSDAQNTDNGGIHCTSLGNSGE